MKHLIHDGPHHIKHQKEDLDKLTAALKIFVGNLAEGNYHSGRSMRDWDQLYQEQRAEQNRSDSQWVVARSEEPRNPFWYKRFRRGKAGSCKNTLMQDSFFLLIFLFGILGDPVDSGFGVA